MASAPPFSDERWLCERNLENFKAQLAATTDAQRRATLLQLISEHERKLADLRPGRQPAG